MQSHAVAADRLDGVGDFQRAPSLGGAPILAKGASTLAGRALTSARKIIHHWRDRDVITQKERHDRLERCRTGRDGDGASLNGINIRQMGAIPPRKKECRRARAELHNSLSRFYGVIFRMVKFDSRDYFFL